MAMNLQSRTMFGYWLLLASAVAGLLVSLYDYTPGRSASIIRRGSCW